jgi:hypothetical protein
MKFPVLPIVQLYLWMRTEAVLSPMTYNDILSTSLIILLVYYFPALSSLCDELRRNIFIYY